MTKLQVRRHARARKAPKGAKIVASRISTTDGDKIIVRALDANSRTFATDFLYVFKQNVRKARKENRERVGTAGRVVTAS